MEPTATQPLTIDDKVNRKFCYYTHDLTKNVSELLDGAEIIAAYDYTPFGDVTTNFINNNLVNNHFAFSSEYHDDELGLIYYNYRYYNPTDGRWETKSHYNQALPGRDPIAEQGGMNLYNFVQNNAMNTWDILGFFTLMDAKNSLKNKKIAKDDFITGQKLLGSGIGGAGIIIKNDDYYAYSDTQIFNEWLFLEEQDMSWFSILPKTDPPCLIKKGDKFEVPKKYQSEWGNNIDNVTNPDKYHPGGKWEIRSPKKSNGAGHQAIYDANGILMMKIPSAGTADRYSGIRGSLINHFLHYVSTFDMAITLKRIKDYYLVRPMPEKGDN